MEQYKLVITSDHKAKIVHGLKFVCNEDHVFNLHPMYYMYAQLAKDCVQAEQMTLVRMLMHDFQGMSAAKAVILADALMMDSTKRLLEPHIAQQQHYRIHIEHAGVDRLGITEG